MNLILYEINTRCWLHELSERLGRLVTLATVPDEEFARWQELGMILDRFATSDVITARIANAANAAFQCWRTWVDAQKPQLRTAV